MERLQGKIVEVIGPLSRLWKGLEDIHKAQSSQAELPLDKFITLVGQVIFLLSQASLSVSYTQLKILEKQKPCLKK